VGSGIRRASRGHHHPAPLIRLGSDRYSPKYRESGLSPFLIECERAGKRGRFEVLSIDRVQPPTDVAQRLHVDEDSPSVLRRENVFWADDDPVYRVTTYVPWTIAEGTGLVEPEVPHPLDVMTKDTAAIRLYERLSWTRIGTTRHNDGHGHAIDALCYVGPPT
jgi:hypothetical protein